MRAQILTGHGGPENFKLTDVAKPALKPGTVLLRIHAASVNPIDIKIREGLPIGPDLPAILGADLAGTVEAVAPDVQGFRPGDQVFGCAGGVRGHGGTLADYIVADARLVAHKPRTLSMREAAALPLVSITAWEGLERTALAAADHVLIHGGTGGVGHVAVQLAKARGARVAASVSSAEAAAIARDLGADDTINFREEEVASYVRRLTGGRGFDLVFDTVGGANLANSFAAAASHGRIATTNARTTADLAPLHAKALSLHVVFMLLPMLEGTGREAHGDILRRVAALADEGRLRPLIDPARFTLETAADAHRHLGSGKARGKVVIDIQPET
ncbi:zinc-dependent alcohol dehydrogenase family protein [Telmatospirillum siberiense]|uniref:Quinone oxidoreductase n=1 Tax=Telmatospirillum siberiense TaxID=382514 RepID=A0A2N3Q0F5_9PROT|nr:zinc-dependent alcohol dehydrogenase family protein [Telmatospirillum siberiense]PKU26139.1 quinone oxidoreductase [Telmatospirillum siberiense]